MVTPPSLPKSIWDVYSGIADPLGIFLICAPLLLTVANLLYLKYRVLQISVNYYHKWMFIIIQLFAVLLFSAGIVLLITFKDQSRI